MSPEQLSVIETHLEITLPGFYREAMMNYPFRPLDEFDCVEDDLVKEVEWIVSSNQELRTEGFFGAKWPQTFFAIGHDGFGNYYFLNLQDNDPAVYFADHEEAFDHKYLEQLEFASDVDEYIEICLECQQDVINNA